jgi:hypothetical protein
LFQVPCFDPDKTLFKVMTKHAMERYPDVAEGMKRMHEKDPKKWGREMKLKRDAAPEA